MKSELVAEDSKRSAGNRAPCPGDRSEVQADGGLLEIHGSGAGTGRLAALLGICVRIWGEVVLTFGIWGPGWVEWFELWMEPAIIISWVALLVWALHHELNRRPSADPTMPENTMSAD